VEPVEREQGAPRDLLPGASSISASAATGSAHEANGTTSTLTEYRDCIQHNASLTRRFGEVFMDKGEHGVWLVSAMLPDNPETKS